MKIRKKRKKDIEYKKNIKKSLFILIMLVCIIIAMITYWIYAYHSKYGKNYFDDIKLISYKINDYVELDGDKVYLKNINKEIIDVFMKNQERIINDNNVISVDITKGIYDEILSIMINYTIKNNSNNYEEVLTLNVDLKRGKILNNEDLLNIGNTNYKNIATDIFNKYIKLASDSNNKVVDAITDKEMSASEFNNNSEKYIIRIREKLPDIIKLYIEDNKLHYIVELYEISKVCYYTNEDNRLVNIKKEIGKI